MTIKQLALAALSRLPEDCNWDDVHYHLYVRQKVAEAEQDFERGEVLTMEEMEHHFAKWLEK
ncbi:MAG: hypothetical protein HY816_09220 [Candidatus Wallbacteria bacterium]|nr:hypothetical protein [Candidatus Wallbacteria bacterium]